MKKNKTNYLVVALIVILLLIAVGYAAFAQTLKITGTVVAKAKWDIHFENPEIDSTDAGNSVSLAALDGVDNTKLNVAVKLVEPGDKRTVTVDIKNGGTVDATLTSIDVKTADGTVTNFDAITGDTETMGAIQMTLVPTPSPVSSDLLAGDTLSGYELVFEWPSDYDDDADVDQTASFEVTLNYDQKV